MRRPKILKFAGLIEKFFLKVPYTILITVKPKSILSQILAGRSNCQFNFYNENQPFDCCFLHLHELDDVSCKPG
jgi:hypothetical protein